MPSYMVCSFNCVHGKSVAIPLCLGRLTKKLPKYSDDALPELTDCWGPAQGMAALLEPSYSWSNQCSTSAVRASLDTSALALPAPCTRLYWSACNVTRAADYSHMTSQWSPWQHILSMRIIWQNGESDTPTHRMRCTRLRLNRCPDNTKLAYHRRVRYKTEWIYTQAKVRIPDNIELSGEEKKTRRLRFLQFLWFLYIPGSGIPDCFHGQYGAW